MVRKHISPAVAVTYTYPPPSDVEASLMWIRQTNNIIIIVSVWRHRPFCRLDGGSLRTGTGNHSAMGMAPGSRLGSNRCLWIVRRCFQWWPGCHWYVSLGRDLSDHGILSRSGHDAFRWGTLRGVPRQSTKLADHCRFSAAFFLLCFQTQELVTHPEEGCCFLFDNFFFVFHWRLRRNLFF